MSDSRSTIRAALITAAAMLISAPIGALIGRATAPPAASAPPTETVTVTVRPPDDPAPDEAEPAAGTDVFWQGELVWGDYSLDTNPPTKDPESPDDRFENDSNSEGGFLRTPGDGVLAVWAEDSTPDEEDCRASVAGGRFGTKTLSKNDWVCGRTSAGRLFRIHILGAGQAEVSGQVTVWAKSDTP